MTIQTTRWSPDTCPCIIEYQWDDTQTESTRTHTIANVINKCAAHNTTADNNAHWNILMDENPRKNTTLGLALSNLTSDIATTDAGGSLVLKSGITFNWSWTGTSPNRVLNISFTGVTLTTAKKNNLQTALNNQFGTGKVVVG